MGFMSEERKQKDMGLTGSALLFIGTFLPIVSMGNLSKDLFGSGKGDGILMLGFAALAAILVVAEKYKGLWFSIIPAALLLISTFVEIERRKSEFTSGMEDNPFAAGLAQMMVGSIGYSWGWLVLLAGLGLLIKAATMDKKGQHFKLPKPNREITAKSSKEEWEE